MWVYDIHTYTTKKLTYILTEIANKSEDPQFVGKRMFSIVSKNQTNLCVFEPAHKGLSSHLPQMPFPSHSIALITSIHTSDHSSNIIFPVKLLRSPKHVVIP